MFDNGFARTSLWELVGEALRVVLQIHNTDNRAFEVSTALHTYLQVSDIDDVRVEGLDNTMVL